MKQTNRRNFLGRGVATAAAAAAVTAVPAAAQGDKPTEAELEVQFQRSVVHARHIRDRAFDLLEKKSAAKRTAPAGA